MLSKTLEDIKRNNYQVEIFGLGYVGFPLAVRLASNGLRVIGIDTSTNRINRLINNLLMDTELRLKTEFFSSRNNGNLELTISPAKSDRPKIGIICVPTPIPDGITTSDVFVRSATENFLGFAKQGDMIILESSIEVGTTERIKELIESKGFTVGKDFGLGFCPERIDPDNKEWHIENIPRVIYCSDDVSFDIAKQIYKYVNNASLIRVNEPKIAEIVKSFENAFRLVNISLVNELAILCDKLGINVKNVIDAAATKPFGFLPHYPGAGAGGHCIPKDPRFLLESARKFSSNFSTIENALKVNAYMPKYISDSIEKSLEKMNLPKSVLVCGLSYKANVEDMRDSASFKVITELKSKGFKVFGYDPFFKSDHIEKYLIENNLKELNFEVTKEIDEKILLQVSCLCIIQHHQMTKKKIDEIYENSLVPFIYDCQNKISKNSASRTILDYLGD